MEDIGALFGRIVAAPFICIGWIIVGTIAGALARRIMHSRNAPLYMDLLLGILGAIVGGILVSLFGLYKPDGGLALVAVNLVVATVGASVLIWLIRKFTGRRT